MTAPTATRDQEITYGYFGRIAKWEKLDDGTLMVFGKAAGADLDLDEQICDPDWLAREMPAWFEWGNVREQHTNIAAGVGKEMTADGSDYYLKAHVVDPGTVKKVETGVLKGFSLGAINGRVIRDKAARGGRINDGKIAEISLVDRPANATCSISIAKSVGGTTLMPVEAEIEPVTESVGPVILDDPIIEVPSEQRAATIERSVSWYREALRTVADAHAGRWSHTVTFINKAAAAADDGEQADVAAAYAAMDQILDLIAAEAQQAKGGRIKELRDIEVLLSAARSLCCFVDQERDEDDDDDDGYDHDGPVMAHAYKSAGTSASADGPDTVDDATAEIITKAVTAARVEFGQAHEAELATLRDQLEKALGAPTTGGPVTFSRVTTKTSSAAPSQAPTQDDPAYWTALAADPKLDGGIARAYLAKAASLTKGAST